MKVLSLVLVGLMGAMGLETRAGSIIEYVLLLGSTDAVLVNRTKPGWSLESRGGSFVGA